jgi:hypothetical protein
MYQLSRENQGEFVYGRFAGQKQRTFAAIPKSIIQTSPGLMPRIVVLQAIKHQCAFKR